MKAGITIVLAVLALAVLAAAQGPSLNLTLEGTSRPSDAGSNSVTKRWGHELTASGSCVGTLTVESKFKAHTKFGQGPQDQITKPAKDNRCNNAPDTYDPKAGNGGKTFKKEWGSNLEEIKWTLTCTGGSKSGTLQGKETNASNTPICTDGSGFHIKAGGDIQGGTGDFQNATGTWAGVMTVDKVCCAPAAGTKSCNEGSCKTTGTLRVTLNP